jgi:hypothetical protein
MVYVMRPYIWSQDSYPSYAYTQEYRHDVVFFFTFARDNNCELSEDINT